MEELYRQWVQTIHPLFVVRATLASALVFAVIVACCKAALPQLQLDFLWRTSMAVPLIYLYLGLMFIVYAVIPPRIEIRRKLITIQRGQHVHIIKAKSILRTRLVFFANDRIRLRIIYSWQLPFSARVRVHSVKLGVSPRVDFDKLCELLPAPPLIVDARGRSHAAPRAPC